MPITANQMRTLLVDGGLVSKADFDASVSEANRLNLPIDEVIGEKNLAPDNYLGQLIGDNLGYPFARLDNISIPDHILRIVPERVARKSKVVSFGMDDLGRLRVAMRDPENLEMARLIEKKIGVRVVPYFATKRGIDAAIEHYARDLESAIKGLIKEAKLAAAAREESGNKEEDEDDGTVVKIVELVMNYAYQNNASDVHVEPREKEVVIRYRIDGILHDVVELPREMLEPFVTRIKILAKMRTDEHFAAQDGKFQEMIGDERIDVRVSVLPIVDGEKIVMRLLTEKGKSYSLQDLGLFEEDMKKVNRQAQKAFGMILATGPTGSGKTTTMYSVLKLLNTRDVNIATIEDPIEYAIQGVNQIQVNTKTGLTFASGLRSIVRQDPDIIMVGEIRDEETASISINAAMTGHLVLSTLHTNDAATTLPRFRDMKIEPFLIASSVNVIIAQRLVRKVCGHCIVSYQLKPEEFDQKVPEQFVKQYFLRKKNVLANAYRGKGCPVCNQTGYKGRIGIFEVLEMDDSIRELIMQDATSAVIAKKAIENGMTTMFEDGLRKVLSGQTTLDEVIRVAGAN